MAASRLADFSFLKDRVSASIAVDRQLEILAVAAENRRLLLRQAMSSLAAAFAASMYNDKPIVLFQRCVAAKTSPADAYSSGAFPLLLSVLKHDYVKVANGWTLAARLADFAVRTAIEGASCSDSAARKYFSAAATQRSLSDALASLLSHLRTSWLCLKERQQKRNRNSRDGAAELLEAFEQVSTSLAVLCAESAANTAVFGIALSTFPTKPNRSVLTALDLKLLLDQDGSDVFDSAVLRCLLRVVECLRSNPGSNQPLEVTRKRASEVCALLRWRLVEARRPEIAKLSCQILVRLFRAQPMHLDVLQRHASIQQGVLKWKGSGFDAELRALASLADRQSREAMSLQGPHEAAARIQSLWRGQRTRRRLASMHSGFVALQRMFRARRQARQLERSQLSSAQQEAFDRAQTDAHRDRQYQLLRYHTIAGLHPSLVDRFLQSEADMLATRIQACYRGYCARKQTRAVRDATRRHRAAVRIQQGLRRLVERRRLAARAAQAPWEALTEARRDELQAAAAAAAAVRSASSSRALPPIDEQRRLHARVQQMLAERHGRRRDDARSFVRWQTLIARLHHDCALLDDAPSLEAATERDVLVYASHSAAVRRAAAAEHRRQLALLEQPWWRRLDASTDTTDF